MLYNITILLEVILDSDLSLADAFTRGKSYSQHKSAPTILNQKNPNTRKAKTPVLSCLVC